jgi:hypothetical protein
VNVNQTVIRSRVARRIRSLPAQCAARVINIPAVANRLSLGYERSKEKHKANLPNLSALDAEIVAGLERCGVYMTSLDALNLAGSREMFASGRKLRDIYAERSASGSLREYYTVQATAEEVMQHREIYRWGLQERLLHIAECYLGLPVGYDGINIFYTVADGRQSGARRWHRDVEDRRMLKVTVYFNDVAADGGPLEILHRHFPGSDCLSGSNYPVLTQEDLEQRLGAPVGAGDVTSCMGTAGTVIFSDLASYYHRGKPAVSHDRCAAFFNYVSNTPLRPFYCGRTVLSRAEIAELVMDLSRAQRASALWQDQLPWLARIVPLAPL